VYARSPRHFIRSAKVDALADAGDDHIRRGIREPRIRPRVLNKVRGRTRDGEGHFVCPEEELESSSRELRLGTRLGVYEITAAMGAR
jgi:hypothetical protein